MLLDPAAAHPELDQLRHALNRRDWSVGRAVLDATPASARTTLMMWAARERGIDDWLRYVVGADPEDTTAAALLGFNMTEIGWAVRTGATAEFVNAEQFTLFHDWLRHAEVVLIDAAARRPGDPAVWTARLLTARGLELGLDEVRRRYERLAAADPHHLPGQVQFLQSLCPKWGGSWDELHAWSSAAMNATPAGAPQASLVAEAHFEQCAEEGDAYLAAEPVRTAIYQAAQRSVWDPGFRRDPGWVRVASTFALLFSMIGDHRAAGSMFGLLGDLASDFPWKYFGPDIAGTIRTHRSKALAAAR